MKTEVLNISRKVGLIDLFKEKGFKVGVEIGTDRGGYAKNICERFPEVKLYTIDPWIPYNEGKEIKDIEKMVEIEEEARQVLSQYPNCEILKDTSINVSNKFEDNSIDFVFIDGNHEYEYVLLDLVAWSKKVKSGGIIAGHDYVEDPNRKYGIIEAVNSYTKMFPIDTLYILRKGSFVDCFMFYKP